MQLKLLFHFLPVIIVNWTISQSINVTEGEGVEVRLSGEAFGPYDNPISIGVVCIESISTGVEPGMDNVSSTETMQHTIVPVVLYVYSYTTLSTCCLQHSPAKTTTSQMERRFTSWILSAVQASHLHNL